MHRKFVIYAIFNVQCLMDPNASGLCYHIVRRSSTWREHFAGIVVSFLRHKCSHVFVFVMILHIFCWGYRSTRDNGFNTISRCRKSCRTRKQLRLSGDVSNEWKQLKVMYAVEHRKVTIMIIYIVLWAFLMKNYRAEVWGAQYPHGHERGKTQILNCRRLLQPPLWLMVFWFTDDICVISTSSQPSQTCIL